MLQRTARLPFDNPPPWRTTAQPTVMGWWRMAAALAAPDGGLPQLGNAAWGRFGRNAPPQRFGATSFVFPYGGLAVQRGAWTAGTAYLSFYHRRAARGHAMAGSNSVQVAAFGRQLLAAGGSALYGGPGTGRPDLVAYLAETSSAKACTVLVDGRSQAGGRSEGLVTDADGRPDITRAPLQPAWMRWLASPEFDLVEAGYREGYRGTLDDPKASLVDDVRGRRCVIFVRAMSLWLIVDTLHSPGTHEYTQVWKFSPPANGLPVRGFAENQVDLRAGERIVQTVDAAPGAVNLRVQQFGIAGLQYRRFYGSGGFGWHAAAPLSAPVPAVDVHMRWRGRGDQTLVTLLLPMRSRDAPLARIDDRSTNGQPGCDLFADDGRRLTLRAASTRRALSADGLRAAASLLLTLTAPGREPVGIVLDHDGGALFEGVAMQTRAAIATPEGFHWHEGADRALTPAYRARS